MSERGSFVTEYIYCDKCFEAAKKVLLFDEKYLCSRVIDGWGDEPPLRIIAGKVGGSHAEEEFLVFEFKLNHELSDIICHPLRIAVLGESGEQIFTVKPFT